MSTYLDLSIYLSIYLEYIDITYLSVPILKAPLSSEDLILGLTFPAERIPQEILGLGGTAGLPQVWQANVT